MEPGQRHHGRGDERDNSVLVCLNRSNQPIASSRGIRRSTHGPWRDITPNLDHQPVNPSITLVELQWNVRPGEGCVDGDVEVAECACGIEQLGGV